MQTPAPAPSFNLAAHVLAQAATSAQKQAMEMLYADARPDVWTYAQLDRAVRGVASGLLQLGMRPNDRVLMRLGNTPDFPVLFLACITAGLIPVPTSSQLTATEITAICKTIGPALIVAGRGVALPVDPPCAVLPAPNLIDMASLPPCDFACGDPNRPAYIIFTSGTSGRPQAVVHAHRAILGRQMMMQGWYGLTAQDRMMHAGAFNWTYTLGTGLLDPWTMGATALIPAPGTPPSALPALIARHTATIFAAAPGIYRQMLRMPMPALPTLRHGLSAGEALSPALRQQWQTATNTDLHEAFGMSEVSTFLSGSPQRPAPIGTTGYPQPGRKIALLDDTATPAPRGTIAVHRTDPGLFLEYLDSPATTAARFAGEWFLTGDQGELAPDGAVRYLGRADDMMNAGGYRLSPLEVEAAMATFPTLSDCAVVEAEITPGTKIIACHYAAPTPLKTTALEQHAAQTLARYKQPRAFVHHDSLPRNANGKLNRRALRDWPLPPLSPKPGPKSGEPA